MCEIKNYCRNVLTNAFTQFALQFSKNGTDALIYPVSLYDFLLFLKK